MWRLLLGEEIPVDTDEYRYLGSAWRLLGDHASGFKKFFNVPDYRAVAVLQSKSPEIEFRRKIVRLVKAAEPVALSVSIVEGRKERFGRLHVTASDPADQQHFNDWLLRLAQDGSLWTDGCVGSIIGP